MMQKSRAGGACCGSQGEWMLGIPKRNGENGFLRQTCRHMLRTSAAERLTDPLQGPAKKRVHSAGAGKEEPAQRKARKRRSSTES